LTPDADGPEVAVEAMASGAMVHPCEFFLCCILQRILHFAKNVFWNNAVCPEKFFSSQKSKTPFLT
jgi:hypothetical protein